MSIISFSDIVAMVYCCRHTKPKNKAQTNARARCCEKKRAKHLLINMHDTHSSNALRCFTINKTSIRNHSENGNAMRVVDDEAQHTRRTHVSSHQNHRIKWKHAVKITSQKRAICRTAWLHTLNDGFAVWCLGLLFKLLMKQLKLWKERSSTTTTKDDCYRHDAQNCHHTLNSNVAYIVVCTIHGSLLRLGFEAALTFVLIFDYIFNDVCSVCSCQRKSASFILYRWLFISSFETKLSQIHAECRIFCERSFQDGKLEVSTLFALSFTRLDRIKCNDY